MIYIESKKKSQKTLERIYPNAIFLDVTSKASFPWNKFSPFYPHGNIPVIDSPNIFSKSVEGVWQGLKVFQDIGIDITKFDIDNMKGIKRTVRKYGKVIGHQKGLYSKEILNYEKARNSIFLKSYGYLLDNFVQDLINEIVTIAKTRDIVLLDYNTNEEIGDLEKPLSHAALIKKYIIKKYPNISDDKFSFTLF